MEHDAASILVLRDKVSYHTTAPLAEMEQDSRVESHYTSTSLAEMEQDGKKTDHHTIMHFVEMEQDGRG